MQTLLVSESRAEQVMAADQTWLGCAQVVGSTSRYVPEIIWNMNEALFKTAELAAAIRQAEQSPEQPFLFMAL